MNSQIVIAEHLPEWNICRTTQADRRNANDHLTHILEYDEATQHDIKKEVRYLVGFSIPKEIIKIIKSYLMFSTSQYADIVRYIQPRITLNRTYLNYSFYKDYLKLPKKNIYDTTLGKLLKDDDGDLETSVIYFKNPLDAEWEYSCMFLCDINLDGGKLYPIIKTKINTSSAMAMTMSGMFDDDPEGRDEFITHTELMEKTVPEYQHLIKNIINQTCKHRWECGCNKTVCIDCIRNYIDDDDEGDLCENEDCREYYTHRNDNCDCGGRECGYCK